MILWERFPGLPEVQHLNCYTYLALPQHITPDKLTQWGEVSLALLAQSRHCAISVREKVHIRRIMPDDLSLRPSNLKEIDAALLFPPSIVNEGKPHLNNRKGNLYFSVS